MSSLSPLSRRYFVTGRSIVTPEEIGRQKTSQIWSKTVIQPVNNIVKQIKIISKYFGYALPRQVGNQYSVLSVYVGWEIGISPQNIHQSHWAPAIHLLRLPGMRISGVVCEMWHQQWHANTRHPMMEPPGPDMVMRTVTCVTCHPLSCCHNLASLHRVSSGDIEIRVSVTTLSHVTWWSLISWWSQLWLTSWCLLPLVTTCDMCRWCHAREMHLLLQITFCRCISLSSLVPCASLFIRI